jgi:hypothetical protein
VRIAATGTAGEVALTVHNDGGAIPAEVQMTIFEPLARYAPTEVGSTTSIGLRLSIAARSFSRTAVASLCRRLSLPGPPLKCDYRDLLTTCRSKRPDEPETPRAAECALRNISFVRLCPVARTYSLDIAHAAAERLDTQHSPYGQGHDGVRSTALPQRRQWWQVAEAASEASD